MNLPCVECGGDCCTGHRGVFLDDGTLLPFVDGRCPNLGGDGLCTIYETRPTDCRAFDCSKDPVFLKERPWVAVTLRGAGIPC